MPLAAHLSGETLPPVASAGLAALFTGAAAPPLPPDTTSVAPALRPLPRGAGAGAASGALWYYSRRYVGELSLTQRPGGAPGGGGGGVRISTLDFWGRREETRVPVADVRPPLAGATRAELAAAARAPLLPLDGAGAAPAPLCRCSAPPLRHAP